MERDPIIREFLDATEKTVNETVEEKLVKYLSGMITESVTKIVDERVAAQIKKWENKKDQSTK